MTVEEIRSCSSPSLAHGRSLGSVRLNSPPLCSGPAYVLGLLDSAAENLMVRREFQSSLDTCERALDSLGNLGDLEETRHRCFELKAGLCIVGIQALAELNKWQAVLAWVLKSYGKPEKIPVKVLQMCILLYRKVGEPAIMQEVTMEWLKCPANASVAGFRAVVELFLLHVLLPCGQVDEARGLVMGHVGSVAFSEDQRQAALLMVENHNSDTTVPALSSVPESSLALTAVHNAQRGRVSHRLWAVLRFLHQRLIVTRTHLQSFSLQRVLLAAFLLYLLLVRMDPALPSAFPWVSSLLQILRQIWNTMSGTYRHSR